MDHRDDLTWVAIELSWQGERLVSEGTLEEVLRRDLGIEDTHPVFIPATTYVKNGKTITIHLMEGYVFVGNGLDEVRYFALEQQFYVHSVMSASGGPHRIRVLSVLPNSDIQNLRNQLHAQQAADIEVDTWVRVVRGKFRGLEGKVLRLDGDKHAYVDFRLRSLHRITPLPRAYLEVAEPPEGVSF